MACERGRNRSDRTGIIAADITRTIVPDQQDPDLVLAHGDGDVDHVDRRLRPVRQNLDLRAQRNSSRQSFVPKGCRRIVRNGFGKDHGLDGRRKSRTDPAQTLQIVRNFPALLPT